MPELNFEKADGLGSGQPKKQQTHGFVTVFFLNSIGNGDYNFESTGIFIF